MNELTLSMELKGVAYATPFLFELPLNMFIKLFIQTIKTCLIKCFNYNLNCYYFFYLS